MADYMNFPKRWEDFLHDYEFEDSRRIYTNGSRLIPSFRVKQMMEHYFPADVEPVRHGRWLTWEEQFPDSAPKKLNNLGVFCDKCHNHADNRTDYCPNCGAKMDEEVSE